MCHTSLTLQKQNAENLKQIFPEKEYRGLSPNFHIHVSVSELYILTVGLPFLLEEICGPILGIYKSLTDMNVETGAEAALFPGKEYIIGIAVAVQILSGGSCRVGVQKYMSCTPFPSLT
jgi:hypothetical protein